VEQALRGDEVINKEINNNTEDKRLARACFLSVTDEYLKYWANLQGPSKMREPKTYFEARMKSMAKELMYYRNLNTEKY
jgi:hypothetical protein